MDPDSKVLPKMTCDRTKATAIVQNVIGGYSLSQVIEKLKTNLFSVILDELNDRSTTKHLIVMVRFLLDSKPFDSFLALLQPKKFDAVSLYSMLVSFFNEHDIPYCSNLVGYASDGASVMVGAKNSLRTLLKADVPWLFTLTCTCHSLALCAAAATKVLPIKLDNKLCQTYSYFKVSAKHINSFVDIQSISDLPKHKLLKLYDIRWGCALIPL
ncbi:hypothetical protein V9T40_009695 [Parthenolecanium corni]|uniref:DUF4371 domain-containing protein n=1 Tax=Parthenolecanium corni TaxID=536013 RepID=A0AAN9Y8F4_9HEMI